MKQRALRPMPADFPQYAQTMRQEDLMARYRAGRAVVRRWQDELGMNRCAKFGKAPLPDNFAAVAPFHTQAELRRMYGRSGTTIDGWARLCGVKLKRIRPEYVKRDTEDEIQMCLNCEKGVAKCTGRCRRIKGF